MSSNNKKAITIISLLVVNFAVSAFIVIYLFIHIGGNTGIQSALSFEYVENGQYVLYIGTNDKDTYEQIIPTDEARKIVNGICAKYVEGYTVSDAKGGWVDEKDVLTQENTLVYTISYSDEADIIAIMNEVLTALNQNSFLVERRDISSVFYKGND